MSANPKDYFVAFSQLVNGDKVEFERRAAQKRQEDIAAYLDTSKSLRILDLANGRLRPQYTLLKAEGHQVIGIDLANGSDSSWMENGYKIARWIYARHINWNASQPFMDNLVCGDVAQLPFGKDYFDLVSSIAAFEHFLDVPAVINELWRVMQPGGVGWIGIHPFTCPSGGHNISASEIPLRHLPKGVEPWDHLRKRQLAITVPLNGWRIGQYLQAFSEHFEILKNYCVVREGERWLTPEIEAELPEYSRDELTCMAYIIVARKNA